MTPADREIVQRFWRDLRYAARQPHERRLVVHASLPFLLALVVSLPYQPATLLDWSGRDGFQGLQMKSGYVFYIEPDERLAQGYTIDTTHHFYLWRYR